MQQAKRPFPYRHRPAAAAMLLLLSACAETPAAPALEPPEPGIREATRNGPKDAAPGTCWGKTVRPAVIETVTRQVQVTPARTSTNGTITALPVYRTETRQEIVTPRQDNWFETPCPDALTPEFISSLQRALKVRGRFPGEITGAMDASTRRAIRLLQRETGPDSDVLTLATARQLGLIAIPRASQG
jgi:hypothetical protein